MSRRTLNGLDTAEIHSDNLTVDDGAFVQSHIVGLETALATLTTDIQTETTNRANADTSLQATITEGDTANALQVGVALLELGQEITDRTSADTALQQQITVNNAKVGITTTQAQDITTNNAKVGITTQQAQDIQANNAKVGITTQQAQDIQTNNNKVGITTQQATDIQTNNNKVGITTQQTNDITNSVKKTGNQDMEGRLQIGDFGSSQQSQTNLLVVGYRTQSYYDSQTNSVVSASDRTLSIKSPVIATGADKPFEVNTGNAVDFVIDGVSRLKINSDGKIGISKSSPNVELHVDGRAQVSSSSNALIINPTNHTNGTDIECFDPSSNTKKAINLNPYGGNVGIGHTNPSHKLDVNGNGRIQGTLYLSHDNNYITRHSQYGAIINDPTGVILAIDNSSGVSDWRIRITFDSITNYIPTYVRDRPLITQVHHFLQNSLNPVNSGGFFNHAPSYDSNTGNFVRGMKSVVRMKPYAISMGTDFDGEDATDFTFEIRKYNNAIGSTENINFSTTNTLIVASATINDIREADSKLATFTTPFNSNGYVDYNESFGLRCSSMNPNGYDGEIMIKTFWYQV